MCPHHSSSRYSHSVYCVFFIFQVLASRRSLARWTAASSDWSGWSRLQSTRSKSNPRYSRWRSISVVLPRIRERFLLSVDSFELNLWIVAYAKWLRNQLSVTVWFRNHWECTFGKSVGAMKTFALIYSSSRFIRFFRHCRDVGWRDKLQKAKKKKITEAFYLMDFLNTLVVIYRKIYY